MDSLFPSAYVPATTYTHVTPLGVAVVCVVLLVLFYFLLIRGKFVPMAAGFDHSNGHGASSALALRSQLRSDGHAAAGFQSGHEPPVFWGVSGSNELYQDQQAGAREELAAALATGEGVDLSASKAGFMGHSDSQLLAKSQGYGH